MFILIMSQFTGLMTMIHISYIIVVKKKKRNEKSFRSTSLFTFLYFLVFLSQCVMFRGCFFFFFILLIDCMIDEILFSNKLIVMKHQVFAVAVAVAVVFLKIAFPRNKCNHNLHIILNTLLYNMK